MQQRQLRLGDILDDYCPRERRLTNHAIVAMMGPDVKQTRCTTCDAEHEYKKAKLPRHRRKSGTPAALYAQVLASGPKRIAHDAHDAEPADTVPASDGPLDDPAVPPVVIEEEIVAIAVQPDLENGAPAPGHDDGDEDGRDDEREEGPVHRPLIRASLPRLDGQPPPARPAPDFTIRQPGGRQNRFRPRSPRGGQQFQTNRSPGNMGGPPSRGGMPRQGGGRPPQGTMTSRLTNRHGPGRKRSK
jgi:hypothetical protein